MRAERTSRGEVCPEPLHWTAKEESNNDLEDCNYPGGRLQSFCVPTMKERRQQMNVEQQTHPDHVLQRITGNPT